MKKLLKLVPTGSEVVDRNGTVWTVAQFNEDASKALLTCEGMQSVTVPTSIKVEVKFETLPAITGVSEVDLAEQVIHARLDPNAKRLAAIYENGKRYAPADFPDPPSLLAHLYVLHGMDVTGLGDTPMPELVKLHNMDHAERTAGAKFLDHFHNQARFQNS